MLRLQIGMSVALGAASVPLTGWLKIKAGPLKGKSIEPSQAKLSRWLKEKWGQPEFFWARRSNLNMTIERLPTNKFGRWGTLKAGELA